MNATSPRGFPGKWQIQLLAKAQQAWQRARNDGCTSVDEFGRQIQLSKSLYGLLEEEFTTFLALRLSASHWTVGGARETKWGVGDHVRKQRTIPGPYREFLQGIRKSFLVGILTTNYDLVLEKILGPESSGRLGGFKYCDGQESPTGRHRLSSRWTFGPVTITGRVPLLKLHGSLNWAVESDDKIIKYIDARPSRGRRYSPLIVPPEGSERRRLLDEVWCNARRVFREANVWLFCGYSLPDYDDDVRQLISANATRDQSVIVMDQEPKTVCEKLRDILASPRIVVGPPLTTELTSRQITSAISAIAGSAA
jgi:SIR2-like domain